MDKEKMIKDLVVEMLNDSHEAMLGKIDRVFKSGCVNVEDWDCSVGKMILPKCIVAALIEDETTQYYGKDTSFAKSVKKEIANIRKFI